MKKLATLSLLFAVACSGGGSSHTLRVHLYVDTEFEGVNILSGGSGDPCTPYADSVSLVVKDEDGSTVATKTDSISEGTAVGADVDPDTGVNCDVGTVSVPDVPDSEFYEVEVEGVPGSVTTSADELAANEWTLTIVADP